jgi:hypothetical protein
MKIPQSFPAKQARKTQLPVKQGAITTPETPTPRLKMYKKP